MSSDPKAPQRTRAETPAAFDGETQVDGPSDAAHFVAADTAVADPALSDTALFHTALVDTALVDDGMTTVRPSRRLSDAKPALAQLKRLPPRSAADVLELGDPIGEGGMGVVRSAVQRWVLRDVAVKSLHGQRRSDDEELQLLREAWLTASLEHPNVVPVYDVLIDAERGPLIVLKRVKGVTWDKLIDDAAALSKHVPGATDLLEHNVQVLMQLCRAVHFAHQHEVVHRDIKPTNVMIGAFGEVYLLDWGIAVCLGDDPTGRFPLASESSGLAGTPCYMAPEMLDPDSRGITIQTDIYLLGAVLYRIVQGQPPHVGERQEMIDSIERSRPVFDDSVPAALQRIIARAMAPELSDRHPSVEAFRLELYQYLRNRDSMRLADEALSRLDELYALLVDRDASRERLYELFGVCRFGLQEALRSWRGNLRARDALTALLDAMIGYLLREDDAGAAGALLADHPDASDSLRERVEMAIAKQRQQRDQLERLKHDVDPRIGRGTRRLALVAMGIAWTVAPLSANYVDPAATSDVVNYGSPIVLLLAAVLVWYRARASLVKTAINRRFLVAMLVGFCAHMVHVLVTQLASLPHKTELSMGMVSFGAILAVLSYTAEKRMWPLVPVYWLGALVSAPLRDHSAYVLSFCNLLLTVFMFKIWSPDADSRGESAEPTTPPAD
jgi:serine/threonine protein kinase